MSSKLDSTVEGHILKLRDGSLWEVRGLVHPPRAAIVRPRAVPHREGGCLGLRGEAYKLIMTPNDRVEVLSSRYRGMIRYLPELDAMEVVALEDQVKEVYSPSQALLYLLSTESYSEVSFAVRSLIEVLSRESGVPLENFGIGGVYSASVECPDEPIEVIVYGENEGLQAYVSVRRLVARGEGFDRLSQRDLLELYRSWGYEGRVDYNVYLKLMSRRYLTGNYLGYRYNVRLVPSRSRVPYGSIQVKRMGRATAIVRVIDASQSIFTPSTYQVVVESVSEGPPVTKLVSEVYTLDSRFRELLWEGAEALVEGMVEKVVRRVEGREEEEYFRFHLYSQYHTMIPLKRSFLTLEP